MRNYQRAEKDPRTRTYIIREQNQQQKKPPWILGEISTDVDQKNHQTAGAGHVGLPSGSVVLPVPEIRVEMFRQ